MESTEIDELIEILNAARVDYYKTFNKNNKTASVRLRKDLESVAKKCRKLKLDILEYRKDVIDKRKEKDD